MMNNVVAIDRLGRVTLTQSLCLDKFAEERGEI